MEITVFKLPHVYFRLANWLEGNLFFIPLLVIKKSGTLRNFFILNLMIAFQIIFLIKTIFITVNRQSL